MAELPLLVFGPRSTDYDFGPGHPLTPRRFGPGIDLLRSLGAEPGLAPEPASEADLLLCHSRRYLRAVEEWSHDLHGLEGPHGFGIGHGGDDPPFPGMHEAGAMVAGGSMRAMEAILRGDVQHAFHPGGGLHHAMPERASGFCIYDDPALAIALARRAGQRVLYVDLDVHHGDGVQETFWDDPGVLTLSFHETGRYLFPGTGFLNELGQGSAAGTAVNVPFEPETGEFGWLTAVEHVLPWVAAAFGPDIVVSQHGCDTHAWDPLAHLRVTTTAMGAAARLVDRVAHRWAGGRWLATGGGGYDAYRVVPRAWSLVWLAGAHREAPPATPGAWRERWLTEAARYGQAPLPETFDDAPNAGLARDATQREADDTSLARLGLVFGVGAPALFLSASVHAWLDPLSAAPDTLEAAALDAGSSPSIVAPLTPDALRTFALAHRVLPMADPRQGLELLRNALGASHAGQRGEAVAAAVGDTIVGVAVAGPAEREEGQQILAVGVAPAFRRRGIATRLVRALAAQIHGELRAVIGVGERDPFEPLDHELRATIGRRLFESAGFEVSPVTGDRARIDPLALVATRR